MTLPGSLPSTTDLTTLVTFQLSSSTSEPNQLPLSLARPTMCDQAPQLLSCDSQTQQIRHWLETWHVNHLITFDAKLKNRVAWDGAWIHDRNSNELQSDLTNWGFDYATSRQIVEDLVKVRNARCAKDGKVGLRYFLPVRAI